MNTLQLCSIYYTVAVSFDRFLYLSYGLRAETICTVRNSLRVIILISIFSILFILPHWFKYQVKITENDRAQLRCKNHRNTRKDPALRSIGFFLLVTSIGENQLFRKIIHIWLYIPVVYALPFLLLTFINFFTIKLLRKFYFSRRQHFHFTSTRSAHSNEQRERGVTLMLIGIVVLFFICRFPMLINHVLETKLSLTSYNVNDKRGFNSSQTIIHDHCRSRRLFNTAVNFLQTINASANLVFYYLFGKNFRETSFRLAKPVRKCVTRRPNTFAENMNSYFQQ